MKKFLTILTSIILIISLMYSVSIVNIGTEKYYSGGYTYRRNADNTISIVSFENNENLKEIEIDPFVEAQRVVSIEKNAFDCTGVNTLVLPYTLTSVAKNAFYNCNNVENLYWPSQLNGEGCFVDLTNLKQLSISYGNDGFMYDYKESQDTPWNESSSSIEYLQIQDGIRYIGNHAFENLNSLRSVEMPDSLSAIGKYSFHNCESLTSIVLPSSLKSIGDNAFSCDNPTETIDLVLSQNVSFIGENALNDSFRYVVYKDSKAYSYTKESYAVADVIDLEFENQQFDILLGEQMQFKPNHINTSYIGDVYYTSSNQHVAVIDSEGLLQSFSTGTTTISCISEYGCSSAIVNVGYKEGREAKYSLMNISDTYQIKPEEFAIFRNSNSEEFTYQVVDGKSVKVDEDGKVSGLSRGLSDVQITDEQGRNAHYVFSIKQLITSLSCNDNISMSLGSSYSLNVKVQPSNSDNRLLTYSSSNEDIVVVNSSGKITSVGFGTAIVTISTNDGSDVTKKVHVTVSNTVINTNLEYCPLAIGGSVRIRWSTNDGSAVKFKSNDESIAIVDSEGKITGVSAGVTYVVVSNNQGTTYRTIKVTVYENAYQGIDLSEWNGRYYTTENFKKIKNDGINFVYLRAANGGDYKDPIFERNYKAAKEAGLNVGAYHYFIALDEEEAAHEARWMLECIKGKQFEYPIMVDIEEPCYKTMSAQDFNNLLNTYCKIIENAGYKVIIYSYASMLNKKTSSYDNYVAHWNCDGPNVTFKYKANIWQFCSEGKVNGLGSKVDLDISFFDYPTYIKNNHLNGY